MDGRKGTKRKKSGTRDRSNQRSPPPPHPPAVHQGANVQKDFFDIGTKLRGRWHFEKRIGSGAFGQVFLVRDCKENINMAVKTEQIQVKRRSLCMEVGVMRELAKSLNVPYLVACGRTDDSRYMIMELLGKSLFDLKHTYKKGLVTMDVVCRIGIQSMQALQDVHEAGFIHRDVKPANFCLGKHPKVAGNVFIFDFGLARIHLINGAKPRKRRRWKTGFRGTVRYASLATHEGLDMGRVDDLIPIHYMLVEMFKGDLPWRGMQDKHQVRESKMATSCEHLCKGMPVHFVLMGKALELAKYRSEPKYNKICGLLEQVLKELRQPLKMPIRPGPVPLPPRPH